MRTLFLFMALLTGLTAFAVPTADATWAERIGPLTVVSGVSVLPLPSASGAVQYLPTVEVLMSSEYSALVFKQALDEDFAVGFEAENASGDHQLIQASAMTRWDDYIQLGVAGGYQDEKGFFCLIGDVAYSQQAGCGIKIPLTGQCPTLSPRFALADARLYLRVGQSGPAYGITYRRLEGSYDAGTDTLILLSNVPVDEKWATKVGIVKKEGESSLILGVAYN